MTTSHAASEEIQQQADLLRQHLLAVVATARGQLGLSQSEVAQLMGRARMTVQRAEAEGGNVALTSFIEMALAVGLTPRLLAVGEEIASAPDAVAIAPHPANIIHRGYHFNRTQHNTDWDDRKREAALAKAWQTVNEPDGGLSPVMETLVPGHTQAQASAVATAVQWMGSEVGFDFLKRALGKAGYEIVQTAPAGKRK